MKLFWTNILLIWIFKDKIFFFLIKNQQKQVSKFRERRCHDHGQHQASSPMCKGGLHSPSRPWADWPGLPFPGQGNFPGPLQAVYQTPPGIFSPSLGTMVPKRQGAAGERPKKSHEDDFRAKKWAVWRQAKGAGPHQSGGEEAQGRHGTGAHVSCTVAKTLAQRTGSREQIQASGPQGRPPYSPNMAALRSENIFSQLEQPLVGTMYPVNWNRPKVQLVLKWPMQNTKKLTIMCEKSSCLIDTSTR